MKAHNEVFREDQYTYWIYALFSLIGIFLFFRYDITTIYFPVILLAAIAVIFHKLTILINSEEIVAYFNFGLFKRKMHLSEIDFSSIQKIELKWWTGIGIRYTTQGWLYNVKIGEAVRIASKDKRKVFFVSTEEFSTIKRVLSEQVNNEH
ncbi:hypothetical protein [Flavimarina sp. Hel_I_48]|uniref:hypothetical protein n=1 Tax=Flavimarina sp. Hel_I_48 TaxID=1392488 RepID=UPI0004DF9D09|nr:hypothetical protein [Flavimarina sp. Hel_I_48]